MKRVDETDGEMDYSQRLNEVLDKAEKIAIASGARELKLEHVVFAIQEHEAQHRRSRRS